MNKGKNSEHSYFIDNMYLFWTNIKITPEDCLLYYGKLRSLLCNAIASSTSTEKKSGSHFSITCQHFEIDCDVCEDHNIAISFTPNEEFFDCLSECNLETLHVKPGESLKEIISSDKMKTIVGFLDILTGKNMYLESSGNLLVEKVQYLLDTLNHVQFISDELYKKFREAVPQCIDGVLEIVEKEEDTSNNTEKLCPPAKWMEINDKLLNYRMTINVLGKSDDIHIQMCLTNLPTTTTFVCYNDIFKIHEAKSVMKLLSGKKDENHE